jgi:hypothetical protein
MNLVFLEIFYNQKSCDHGKYKKLMITALTPLLFDGRTIFSLLVTGKPFFKPTAIPVELIFSLLLCSLTVKNYQSIGCFVVVSSKLLTKNPKIKTSKKAEPKVGLTKPNRKANRNCLPQKTLTETLY